MKKIILILFVALLVSCQETSENTILNKYSQNLGTPTSIQEEKQGAMTFYTYYWDNNGKHTELIVSHFKGEWEEIRFNSY